MVLIACIIQKNVLIFNYKSTEFRIFYYYLNSGVAIIMMEDIMKRNIRERRAADRRVRDRRIAYRRLINTPAVLLGFNNRRITDRRASIRRAAARRRRP